MSNKKAKLDVSEFLNVAFIYDNENAFIRDNYGGLPSEGMLADQYEKLPEIEYDSKTETVFYNNREWKTDWRLGEYGSWNQKELPRQPHPDGLNVYWVSWYTHFDNFEFPFDYWCSGMRCSDNKSTMVSAVEAKSEEEVWELVESHFSDYEERFCDQCNESTIENVYEKWSKSGRFTGGKRKTGKGVEINGKT